MAGKKTRTQLQNLFQSGAKPSGENFQDFINSVLNSYDDGIEKPAGADMPIRLMAQGEEENLLDFYSGDTHTWRINQQPLDSNPGLNFSTGGVSKLFVESARGSIGISTAQPEAKLHIQQLGGQDALRIEDETNDETPFVVNAEGNVGIGVANPDCKLHVRSSDSQATTDISKFCTVDLKQGIGIGYNRIAAVGSLANQNISLMPKGTGKLSVSSTVDVSGKLNVPGDQQIVFSDTRTDNNLKLQLWDGYGLGINAETLFYAANGNHSWRDASGTNERMRLETKTSGGLAIKGTGTSSFAGHLTVAKSLTVSESLTVAKSLAVSESLTVSKSLTVSESLTTGNNLSVANDLAVSGDVGIGTRSTNPRSALDTGIGLMTGAANDYMKAQFTLSGGGQVTWEGPGGRLKWTTRFIAISMEKSAIFSEGYVDINQPTADIPAADVLAADNPDAVSRSVTTDGVLLNGWEALYAVHSPGGGRNAVSFKIVDHKGTDGFFAPSNWILVAVVNNENGTIKLGTGTILSKKSSSTKGSPIPRGVIMMWHSSSGSIPDGWTLCDGSNGTPNLVDRFVVGAGNSYSVNSTGGQARVTLNTSELPSHNHANGSYNRLLKIDGTHTRSSSGVDNTGSGEPNLDVAGSIQSVGSSQSHQNLPPYLALFYIMKL